MKITPKALYFYDHSWPTGQCFGIESLFFISPNIYVWRFPISFSRTTKSMIKYSNFYGSDILQKTYTNFFEPWSRESSSSWFVSMASLLCNVYFDIMKLDFFLDSSGQIWLWSLDCCWFPAAFFLPTKETILFLTTSFKILLLPWNWHLKLVWQFYRFCPPCKKTTWYLHSFLWFYMNDYTNNDYIRSHPFRIQKNVLKN